MKQVSTVLILLALAAPSAMAQKWEIGGGAGGSFFTSQTVKNATLSGDAGLDNGIAASFWLGNNSARLIGGEVRYDYENSNLKLTSSGQSASFGAATHAVHYDFLVHFTPRGSRLRPFVSAGAGVKLYQGTGKEVVAQPLSNLALLSKTSDTKALISVGGGVKFEISPRVQLRVEVRDAMTPFPTNVIFPAQGSKIGGWLQDFVAMAGLSIIF